MRISQALPINTLAGKIEAIIKSVFSLFLQGFYKSVKMLMTNPFSWHIGRKGRLLSLFFLQSHNCSLRVQNAGGGAFAEEVLASGFTVQRDRAASKAKQAPLSHSHFISWISAWLLTVTASPSSCLPECRSPSPTNDRMSFPLPKCKDQKDKAYVHQPKSVPPWRILKKKKKRKKGGRQDDKDACSPLFLSAGRTILILFEAVRMHL